jgi:hypothetical protein
VRAFSPRVVLQAEEHLEDATSWNNLGEFMTTRGFVPFPVVQRCWAWRGGRLAGRT